MTLDTVRQKVRELHAQTRRKLLGTLGGPVCVGAFSAYGIKVAAGSHPALSLVFAFTIVWSLIGAYFLNRGMWSAPMPGDAALSTGIQFYRQEVERQRAFYGRTMIWSFGPILLALTMFILFLTLADRGQVIPNGLPFLALIALWIALVFVLRMRDRRELRRELDELNDTEGQYLAK